MNFLRYRTTRRGHLTGSAARLLIPLLFFVGCESSPVGPEGLTLSVSGTSFSSGDTIQMSLVNHTSGDVSYNLCLARLERRSAARWAPVQRLPSDGACILVLVLLPAGETAIGYQVVYPFIAAGTYRFAADVEVASARVELRSGPFQIVQ